jgi:vancomycin resistance protein VanJ
LPTSKTVSRKGRLVMPFDSPDPSYGVEGSIDAPSSDEPLRYLESGHARRWLGLAVAIGVWFYLVIVVLVWFLMRFGGDRWWFATVMLFGPRWPYAMPWLALAPAAACARPRLLWPLAAAAIILLGPIMGLCIPWIGPTSQNGPTVRILTCNVDVSAVDAHRLSSLIDSARPDVVALQECSSEVAIHWPEGWHVLREAQLVIASPYPLLDKETTQNSHPPSPWPSVNGMRCRLATPWGSLGFCSVHMHSPREGLSEVLDRQTLVSPARSKDLSNEIHHRRQESGDLSRWLSDWADQCIIAGDFNMPADSAIYRESWCSYTDAFSASGFGFGYTKWTPILGWSYGSRIDHILASAKMKVRRCWVGPDVGSDHLPLLANIVLQE